MEFLIAKMSTAATTPAKKATKKASKPKVPAAHPQYKVMAAAAITSLKERGGSSRQAILKYIMANYKVGTDATKVNSRLKLGLKAAVKGGSLKQVKGTGASGSFKVGEKPKAAKPKAKKATKPKAAKPKKAKKTATKPKAAKPEGEKKVKKVKKAKTPKKTAAKKSPKKAAKKPAAKKPAAKKAAKKTPKKAAKK